MIGDAKFPIPLWLSDCLTSAPMGKFKHSAEENISIALADLRGEDNEPCRAICPSDNGECRALPPRGRSSQPVLQLVEGIS